MTIIENRTSSREGFVARLIVLVLADGVAICAAFLGAILLSYPYPAWIQLLPQTLPYVPIQLSTGIAIFIALKMYRKLWRYASVEAVMIIGYGTLAAVAIPTTFILLFSGLKLHWSVFVIQWMLLVLIVGAGRFSIRVLRHMRMPERNPNRPKLLIYGAGDAGEMIARDILRARESKFKLVGFIDDDPYKQGKSMHNLPVFGGLEDTRNVVESRDIDEILVAMPSAPGSEIRRILGYLKKHIKPRVQLKTVPGITDLLDDRVSLKEIRQFNVSDLLRRAPVELDRTRVQRLINGNSVLVSGAGGSIGSEVCRQVAACNPSRLILFDISEPNLYQIMEEMTGLFPTLELVPVVGDITHRLLVKKVFQSHKPNLVFHAAAYKHVPLMESNPWSAVFNNVTGTRVLLTASTDFNIERFVMISTDKAVRPSSIMGATKRLCEMMVQMQPHSDSSIYSVVRFGNVMGSSGSVIPKFERQIRAGGPITVTHKDVTRFFMLTSEAVQLVLQAATINRNAAIYVLDMGDPIKITDLALDMIQLSGLEPHKDIEINYTGLRPGEKMHEELSHSGFGIRSEIEKIWLTEAPPVGAQDFPTALDDLLESCYSLSRDQLIGKLAKLVPDFQADQVQHIVGARLMRDQTSRITGSSSGSGT